MSSAEDPPTADSLDESAPSQRLAAQSAVHRALEALEDDEISAKETASVVHEALVVAAAALESSTQCQLDEPYADMILINSASGLRLCCTHTPEHCRQLSGPTS